jgi:hypothetical protein
MLVARARIRMPLNRICAELSSSSSSENASRRVLPPTATNKTKAIIVVHYGGVPCEMDEIRKIGKI